jgi:hypothetical protein
MKKTETQEETLARLARTSAKGATAAKRFTSLLKRSIKLPKSEADARLKALKEARKAS